jgi:hypothetical protein
LAARGAEALFGAVQPSLELLQPRGVPGAAAVQPGAKQRDAVTVIVDLGLDCLDLLQGAHAENSETE